MGFFKKIGQAVKKGVKQISLKNAIKVGSMFDPTGLVGGMQEAHYAKKEAKAMQAQGKQQEAEYYAQLADQKATQAGANAAQYIASRTNLQSAITGAVGAVGADATEWTLKEFLKRHWQKIALGLGAVVGLVFLLRRRSSSGRR